MIKKTPRTRAAVVVSLLLAGLGTPLAPSPASGDTPGGRLVGEVAAGGTPHVLDGSVYAVTQVGDTIVLGGSFSRARNDSGDISEVVRTNLLAFSATTGRLSTTFTPSTNGVVRTVVPAGDGTTVYVGGSFTSIGGVARQRVARIRVSDGAVVAAFDAGGVTGQVRDLALTGGRLWLAGAFTHVGGNAQTALATVNPTTGAFSPYMRLAVAGDHGGGATQVLKVAASPDGTRMTAVGNFDTLDGVKNHQLLTLDLTGGASAAPGALRTSFFETPCSSSFDTYLRDVDYAPDGTFFVVTTTGAYGGSTVACDSASRFEAAAEGTDVRPSWIDHTGGDTSYAVEVTPSAVYVGGHQRWWNNPFAADRAGPGAVPREGIAALDPANGLPLAWNPGRAKGVGVFDLLATDQGLWVASDTDRIGDFQYKGRIARFPAAGATIAAVRTPSLPNDVYAGGRTGSQGPDGGVVRRSLGAPGTTPGPVAGVPSGGLDWNTVRGAFMVNGQLYLARSDGLVTRRSFDGSTYGAPAAVDTADQLVVLADWRGDVQNATGMFFQDGRIYFTRAGSNQLFYRYFSPQSGVVGAFRHVASGPVAGFDPSTVRGMFGTSGHLWWATSTGQLRRATWTDRGASRVPVGGSAETVAGPGVDATTWGARALFLFQGADGEDAGPPPTAAFTSSCVELACDLDGSSSTAPGTMISSWQWDLGDGSTATGQTVSHDYGAPGTYQVTLTVRTAGGVTGTTTRDVTVQRTAPAPVALVGASAVATSASAHRVAVPAAVQAGDTLVLQLVLNTTDVAAPATPAGWTLLDQVAGTQVRGLAWSRTATADDAGRVVTLATSATVKGDLSVHAYRGAGGAPVVAHAAVVREGSGTSFAGPALDLPGPGTVLTRWVAKSSVPVGWTLPAGVEARPGAAGSGGGQLTSVGAEASAPAGSSPGRVATTDPAVTRVVSFAVALGSG